MKTIEYFVQMENKVMFLQLPKPVCKSDLPVLTLCVCMCVNLREIHQHTVITYSDSDSKDSKKLYKKQLFCKSHTVQK